MPRNGAGVYSLINNTWFPPTNGVLATSTDWNTFIVDIQNALTQSVSSDGQTAFTGNLPMGNNKITGLANGTAATDAAAFGQVVQIVGQCQLVKSGANLVLLPYNGNKLFINGVLCTVPQAGVSLAPGALAAATVYNIYAVATGTTVTSLEASVTARATDVTYGNQIKSGDPTRALVGKARTTGTTTWSDTDIERSVISWFNRRPIRIYNSTPGGNITASPTPVGIVAQAFFLCWGDAPVPASFVGSVSNNGANNICYSGLGFDTSTAFSHAAVQFQAYANGANGPATGGSTFIPSEGFHFIVMLGAVSAGTGTWAANIEFSGVIQG